MRGSARVADATFTTTFTIGSAEECGYQVSDAGVAPRHVELVHDGMLWWGRDRSGAAGTFVDGRRIRMAPMPERATLELGSGGPMLTVTISKQAGSRTGASTRETASRARPGPERRPSRTSSRPPREEPIAGPGAAAPSRTFASEEEILEHYSKGGKDRPAGPQTMMFRRAFLKARRRSSRPYKALVALAVLLLGVAGGAVVYQQRKLRELRATAEQLFYTAKAVELQSSRLEELVRQREEPAQVAQLAESRAKLAAMDQQYDSFVQKLGVYDKVPEDERVILKVARLFGECDVNVPKGFVKGVREYVLRWRSTDRLATLLEKARKKGYAREAGQIFRDRRLPPQYLYVALQESGFDERAVGPPTRYGFAKGMWQFIPSTARHYGLKTGPLHGEPVYDPADERFDWKKAAGAAARYIKELETSKAQASGLLVLASYNWGEEKVRTFIANMPENPRDRNFWRLLRDEHVPWETYDYVMSIFSVAVICEDPRLFGFQLECPFPPAVERPDGGGGSGSSPAHG